MMQQYLAIKEQYKDAILFYRLGDFYEMFFDDAELVSRELELTLTGKDCGLSERAPMCGVPFHSADVYVARLIEKGYKVAICEQMEDPALAKGLVERAVIRVVTPGTVIESNMLDEHKSSYILSLYLVKDKAGIAFSDVSTGEFYAYQFSGARGRLSDELSRIAPREILCNDPALAMTLAPAIPVKVTAYDGEAFDFSRAGDQLLQHFQVKGLEELGLGKQKMAVSAAGALMSYLNETQKNALIHILSVRLYQAERYLTLDRVAAANLELTESLRGRSRRGSLLWTLDNTVTSMGSRMLRRWIEQPLQIRSEIESRLDAVEALKEDLMTLQEIREALDPVYDIERLLSKIAYDTINARDCLALLRSLKAVPALVNLVMGKKEVGLLGEILRQMDPLRDVETLLESAISPDAPISVREGGLIREGYNAELDKLRSAATDGKTWIAELEQKEREATGIKNLKVGFNRVFGFYIEVTKSFYDLVPYRYTRKQTLANCERYITEELKEIEKTVLGAEENATRLEYELFLEIREQLKAALSRLQRTSQGIKTLDALQSLAQVASENNYVRPSLNEDGVYDIQGGRHPVVEKSLGSGEFVPNDTLLNQEGRLMIITGPNMAGKSTYMRQVALIVLMAHMGSFVPADSANISITDRIFTRIGASDDLYSGQSTFMVEMSEMATILKYATPKSLLILDEVGRGTSTFDGLSIAWAAVEHIADLKKCGARTLFATHYHELSELEGRLDGVVNYRITAMERGNEIIFLRKIVKGGEDRSYGIAVAGLAGLPGSLLARARQIMARLEVADEGKNSIGQNILDSKKNAGDRQVALTDFEPMELVEEIRAMDVLSMSPIDALNALFHLSEKARKI
ncbi:MAG TPA: DNA mismatch repair protein MutS [Candidatus Faecaligallichristensenella faecipullorum]|nr:DNA mismatch repair protein MutS [Candidatus Faecaligallichristensenella faecipullorum]